jgi:hypothetical protein
MKTKTAPCAKGWVLNRTLNWFALLVRATNVRVPSSLSTAFILCTSNVRVADGAASVSRTICLSSAVLETDPRGAAVVVVVVRMLVMVFEIVRNVDAMVVSRSCLMQPLRTIKW